MNEYAERSIVVILEQKLCYKITEVKMTRFLFIICWIVYFSTYLGRLNYSAALTDIIATGSLTKSQGGLIGTGFFLAYGMGQLVSGFLGDKLSPKWMVFLGMMVSSLTNFFMFQVQNPTLMLIIWTINGLSQAFIWSPMVRLLCEYLKEETRLKYCVSINSTVPLGTMAAYGMTALIIYLFSWKYVFSTASLILFGIGIVWFIGVSRIEKYALTHGEQENVNRQGNYVDNTSKKPQSLWNIMLVSGLIVILMVLVIQGALKDGVTTWIPTYMNETYHLGSVVSIIGTMIIPVFNLLGIFIASIINDQLFRNEVHTAGFFFLICAVALTLLWGTSGHSVVLAFVMLTISTTSMMAVNTMLIAVLPSRFTILGKASTVSGLLNSSVYIGGALSTYGIGTLSNIVGWKITILGWLILAIGATIICFCTWKKWRDYREANLRW